MARKRKKKNRKKKENQRIQDKPEKIITESKIEKNKFFCYYQKEYKKLLIIPIILFLVSAFFLVQNYFKTGDLISKDVSLKGGISITIPSQKDS